MVARGAPKNAPRGPASKRHDRTRKDKDGDLAMGLAIKGRGGITKSSARPAGTDGAARTTRRGVLAAGAQRQILKHVGAGDVAMRETRSTAPRGLMELKITGWTKSKASSSADGGVSSLISWLEKKASSRLGSRARYLKVKKVCLQHHAGLRRERPCRQFSTLSGLPSLTNYLTTAIQCQGLRLQYG